MRPARNFCHQEEFGADDTFIGAFYEHFGHWDDGLSQCLHHPKFAIYGVGRFQDGSGWLLAKHAGPRLFASLERYSVGWVRLSGRELLNRDWRTQRRHCIIKPAGQPAQHVIRMNVQKLFAHAFKPSFSTVPMMADEDVCIQAHANNKQRSGMIKLFLI